MNKEQLLEMFKFQEKLNIAYNGENWRDTVEFSWIQSAILTEHVEFLQERTNEWLWYKNNKKLDNEASLFEAIDVVHFMMMEILYHESNLFKISNAIHQACIYSTPPYYDSFPDLYSELHNSLKVFLTFKTISYWLIVYFIEYIDLIQKITGYSWDEFYKAYWIKAEVNQNRALFRVNNPDKDYKQSENKLCLK